MINLSLYEIDKIQLDLIGQLIENDGELTQKLEDALELNKDNLQVKGMNYGLVIKQIEAECDVIDSEIKRLQGLKKARTNTIDRLKNNIAAAMTIFDITELKTPLLKINFRASESVEIPNIDLLDKQYVKTKVEVSADKIAIKEAIKAGETVQGAYLKQNKNIQIK